MTLCYKLLGMPQNIWEFLKKAEQQGVKRAEVILENYFLSTNADDFQAGIHSALPEMNMSGYKVSVHAGGSHRKVYEEQASIFDAEGISRARINAAQKAVQAANILERKGLQAVIELSPHEELLQLPAWEQKILQPYCQA